MVPSEVQSYLELHSRFWRLSALRSILIGHCENFRSMIIDQKGCLHIEYHYQLICQSKLKLLPLMLKIFIHETRGIWILSKHAAINSDVLRANNIAACQHGLYSLLVRCQMRGDRSIKSVLSFSLRWNPMLSRARNLNVSDDPSSPHLIPQTQLTAVICPVHHGPCLRGPYAPCLASQLHPSQSVTPHLHPFHHTRRYS
jgi:hypothetical protein